MEGITTDEFTHIHYTIRDSDYAAERTIMEFFFDSWQE